jgi:hypothetical protein
MNPEAGWQVRVSSMVPLVTATLGTHVVQLYEHDAFLVETVARVVMDGLAAGDAVVTIATASHRRAIEERVRVHGVDLTAAHDEERYGALDAARVLAAYMVDGRPDPERFDAAIATPLDRAANATGSGRVRAFGEMVALLWHGGMRDAALAVEELWNAQLARRKLSLLCAYPLDLFASADDTADFRRMCEQHSHVTPTESYATLGSAGERLRAVVALQQRSAALEAELQRHGHRRGPCYAVTCKRCDESLLTTSRIGDAEADAIRVHLLQDHPVVLRADRPLTLGEVLREVAVQVARA